MYVTRANQIKYTKQVDELIAKKDFGEAFKIASRYWLAGFLCCKKTATQDYKLKEGDLVQFNSKEVTNPHAGRSAPPMILFLKAELLEYVRNH